MGYGRINSQVERSTDRGSFSSAVSVQGPEIRNGGGSSMGGRWSKIVRRILRRLGREREREREARDHRNLKKGKVRDQTCQEHNGLRA